MASIDDGKFVQLGHNIQELQTTKAITAAVTLIASETYCNITTKGTYSITLPPVSENRGATILIKCTDGTGGNVSIISLSTGIQGTANNNILEDASGAEDFISANGDYAYIQNIAGREYILLAARLGGVNL